ncbi:WD40 repeat domain-containing protein [Sporobolomyces salmoneus]|uniref:WD40 repeat domain-containing protein n=1 Tax=Sporobolomyces salmoneus TaxID=183962 RepID=UPI00316CC641
MALHLPGHTLQDAQPCNITGIHLEASGRLFSTSTSEGWVVYQTNPLEPVTRRDLSDSSLGIVLPLERTNILLLVGGPPSPLYPPNKVVFWDDKLGQAVAELEFSEDVRGLAVRKDRLVVALKRRIIIYVLGTGENGIYREGYYDTCDNPKGLVVLATEPGSTLLAFPGRQTGQIQIVRLPPYLPESPPLPPPPSLDPTSAPYPSVSIIVAHTSALSALSTTPSGSVLATTSKQGTLVRVWDPTSSRLIKELRRGTDTAEIFGLSFRKDGGAIAVSSDKGTIHVWDLKSSKEERRRSGGSDSGSSTPRQKQYSLLKPYLPKYFSSEWSHSQFRLPAPALPGSRLPSFSIPSTNATAPPSAPPTVEDDKCICTWIEIELSDDEEPEPQPSSRPFTTPQPTIPRYSQPPQPSSRGRGSSTSSHPNSLSSSPARTKDAATPSLRPQSFRTDRNVPPTPPPPPRKRIESQLIAITQSGGWFRVALDGNDAIEGTGKGKGKEKEKEGKGEETVMGLGRDSTNSCRLVEYRRFGTDGW